MSQIIKSLNGKDVNDWDENLLFADLVLRKQADQDILIARNKIGSAVAEGKQSIYLYLFPI